MKVVIFLSLIVVALACLDDTSCRYYSKKGCQTSWFLKKYCRKYCGLCNGPPATQGPLPSTKGPSPRTDGPTSGGSGQCGRPQISKSRVIGGTVAKAGSWPWQIGMYVRGLFTCGGTLINSRWIVTAQHCVMRTSSIFIKVRLGDHNRLSRESTEQEIQVSKIIEYPGSGQSGNDDIALLKLSKPVMLNKHIQPICLPSKGEKPDVGSKCFITGWGKTRNPGSISNVLMQLGMKVQSKADCKKMNDKYLAITDKMLCASNGVSSGQSGCQGDSGGPFVCQQRDGSYKLHGAVSWGSPRCDSKDAFTVFTRIAEYRSWIDQNIKN